MGIKVKIYGLFVIWLVLCVGVFAYGFNILNASNQVAMDNIAKDQKDIQALQQQEQSFQEAQREVKQMQDAQPQPSEFFSQDITLVKELETLESLGKNLNVKLVISGVSGTIATVPKAPTQSALFVVSSSLSVTGGLDQVVNFLQATEHLGFIMSVNSFTFTALGGQQVNASMNIAFYIRKK